jgi:hypothetical protein
MSGVWPTDAQLALLVAALAPETEAAAALEQVADNTFADNASRQLLPLLYRRWPSRAGQAVLEGKKAYLANWLAYKERMQHVATVTERFAEEGISCMLLKGAAVAIRHYRDAGLRTMRDFDVLVRDTDVARAAEMLMSLGYVAEGGLTASDIDRRRRTRHAWQFYLGAEQSCDLHWRPVVRCFSPGVTDEYWATKEREGAFEVPAASVQLFHICAHASMGLGAAGALGSGRHGRNAKPGRLGPSATLGRALEHERPHGSRAGFPQGAFRRSCPARVDGGPRARCARVGARRLRTHAEAVSTRL